MEGNAVKYVQDSALLCNDAVKDSLSLKTCTSVESHRLSSVDKDQITFGAFVVPFLALIIASGLKYFINSKITTNELWNLLLELSIDSLTIVIAVSFQCMWHEWLIL